MESYIANIFTRKKLIRKIVGDWAWERGMNKKLLMSLLMNSKIKTQSAS